jgi:hypothetical protein
LLAHQSRLKQTMAPKPMSFFTYKGVALPNPPDLLSNCETDIMTTAWIVNQLRQCSSNIARAIVNADGVVKQLWIPKQLRKGPAVSDAPWKLDAQMQCTAIATYLFTERDPSRNICQQCSSSNSTGPAVRCHCPGMAFLNGACTNCYYSGTGHLCSLRQGQFL